MYVHMASSSHMNRVIPVYCINGTPVVLSVTGILDYVIANFSPGITSAIGSTHCHYAGMSWLHCAACMKQTIVPLTSSYCQFVQLCFCLTETTLDSVYFALIMHGCVVNQKLSYFYTCSTACMHAAKACMHVAHVFQESKIQPSWYAAGTP